MAEFTETVVKTVTCPYCAGAKIVKNGTQRGEQRYMCRGCGKTFTESGKLHGHQFTTEQIGAAIRMFYSGTSYKQIAEHMEDIYDIPEPSKPAIYYWVRDYTDAAVERMKDYPADTSPHWVGDESTVNVGGEQYWNWNIMDKGTRYILASHLSKERDAAAAKAVIRKALAAAEKPPKTITTDKWRSYIPAIKELLPETTHIQSEGLRAEINNNLSERVQGTFRQREKTLRGLDSKESGQRYLDGWVLHYNLFRDHESLGYASPGAKANVMAPFEEWADVVRMGTTPTIGAIPKRRRNPKVKAPKLEPPKAKRGTADAEPGMLPPGLLRGMPKAMRPKASRELKAA